VGVGEGGAKTDARLAGAAAVEVRKGGVETDTALAGAPAVEVGEGGVETDTALAGAPAVEVGEGGAEREAVLACTADLDAGTSALGGALRDKRTLRPSPTAMEKRIARTVPNGVSITAIKFLAQSSFLFTVIVIGGGSVRPYVFCALIIALALFIAASALLLATTAAMTAATALTAAIIAATRAADS
jgi:hypothetical protein